LKKFITLWNDLSDEIGEFLKLNTTIETVYMENPTLNCLKSLLYMKALTSLELSTIGGDFETSTCNSLLIDKNKLKNLSLTIFTDEMISSLSTNNSIEELYGKGDCHFSFLKDNKSIKKLKWDFNSIENEFYNFCSGIKVLNQSIQILELTFDGSTS
jgi:hypothetical protein